ncbi:MAG: tetratricopeptide repeat protein [Pyrinomonadaceae bacterium]
MKKILGLIMGFMALGVIFSLFICGKPAAAQDLVAVSDITGGASVFIFRGSSRAAPKKFISGTRTVRTKAQRFETARRVTRQFIALAKIVPRRIRVKSVDPNNLPASIKTMPKEQASKLFAGVGEYYMDRNEFDNAIDFFRESVSLDSASINSKTGLSEALALKGNELLVKDSAAAARKFFEEALTYNPKNAPAHFGLGEVFAGLEKDDEATASYERALDSDKDLTEIYVPLGILYYQKGEIAKADTLLTRALATSPNDAQTQYFLGLIRFSQNRNPEALTAFQNAKTGDPANSEAFYYAAETASRLNKHNEALEDYQKAAALKPHYFEAWLGRGAAYYQLGNWTEAVAAYKEAVRLKNDNATAFENLGDAYRQLEKFNDAESNYNLAALFIERTKDFSREQAADIYSKAAFMIAKQCEINMTKAVICRWPVAVRHLEKATTYSQSSVDYANLGWAYYNEARSDLYAKKAAEAAPKLEKAKLNLQKAAESNSNFVAGPLLNLGMALTDMGDYPGAVEALTRVVQREPKWAFAINELGIAYRKQNNLKEAANQFRKAVGADEKFAAAYYNLGEAEFRSGNLGEAKKAYAKLNSLGRKDLAGQLELISSGKVKG